MASLLFLLLLLLLLLYPLCSLTDSSIDSSTNSTPPISSIIPDTYSLPDSTGELRQSAQLAANAPTLSPYELPNFVNAPSNAMKLVSFTGGKGNYRSMSREFLSSHNEVRATVQEPPFVWDRQLARFAKRWADKQRESCRMEHSMGPYGENMFWGTGWSWRAADAVREWAREQYYYSSVDNSCAPGQICGHFTQIIWNSTIRIGCGRTECINGGVIITCNYDPPGNFVGENPLKAAIPSSSSE